MATVSLAPVWMISLLCCFCGSFVSSGILSGPARGYQQTYSSSQSQSYNSQTGAYRSVTVTSRQCNVIRRMTQYETVRVPFLCQAGTGRVAPLPPGMESNRAQILNAMQAGGWSMCYQPITVPIYRYQRIPVCCPGTTPTSDGRCICTKEVSAQAPVVVPAPGQLLNSNSRTYNDRRPSTYPGYEYRPTPSTPVRVQPPRPYRGILSNVPPSNRQPNSLLQQVSVSGTRGGPSYTVTNNHYPPTTTTTNNNRLPTRYYPSRPPPRPQSVPSSRPPVAATPGGGEELNDIASYLAAMMYQKLLVEQQEKILQEEINRQLRIRQQMEFMLAHQRRLARLRQQQQQQQQQQQPGGRYPTLSSQPTPNPQPRPLPSPPIQAQPSMPQPEVTTAAPETDPMPVEDGGDLQELENRPVWPGGILDEMQKQDDTGATSSAPMFGNGPTNIPPESQALPTRVLEMKEKVKGMVDACLRLSGITSSMETILQSGDLDQLRPVCRASDTVGPCVMRSVESSLGQDQMGMVGRQMMQSVFMSLGQLCLKLENVDKATDSPAGDMTSPPVFPNPAPSVTQPVVTEGTVENTSDGDTQAPTDNNNNNNNNNNDDNINSEVQTPQDSPNVESQPPATVLKNSPPESKIAGDDVPSDIPAATPTSAAKAQAHSSKEKTDVEVDEAAFPLWMILAMVGACAALLLFSCLTICLVLRCRRKKKTLELDRQPEKLPVPAEGNIYAASPCQPPPAYPTTAVRQTLGGGEEVDVDPEFKIPEDTDEKVDTDPSAEKTPPGDEEVEVEEEEKGKEEN